MPEDNLQQAIDLATRLSIKEQLTLVARISEGLSDSLGSESGMAPPGSPAAVLQAMRAPPHLAGSDVDELDRAIEAGRLIVRHEALFNS